MADTITQTPNANRLHIGFFGRRNSGKSSLVNAFAGQEVSIVSDVAGTTTDPVSKAMEISPLGPCVLMDTAGFDDVGELGLSRVDKTKLAAQKADLAVVVLSSREFTQELDWIRFFQGRGTPCLLIINKADLLEKPEELANELEQLTKLRPLIVSAKTGQGIDTIKPALARLIPEDFGGRDITGPLAKEGDTVLLVMPQDIQAPKGRLILPQVQTIRELLDKKCTVISVTTDRLEQALSALKTPPKLIITDSQVFRTVYEKKPRESLLTSFSVLFAAHKGDLSYYLEGAKAIDRLTDRSKVLIAESCTHAPLQEDIGRVKIPRLLRKRFGEGLQVDLVSGTDYPEDLTGYDLIIQCGACMFNRKYVLSRIDRAKEQQIPMTNYGVAIAHLSGILSDIAKP